MFLVSISVIQFVLLLSVAQGSESPADNFQELGSLFLWGIIGAICVAVLVVLIWLKIQSRRATTSDYVSINPSRHEKQG